MGLLIKFTSSAWIYIPLKPTLCSLKAYFTQEVYLLRVNMYFLKAYFIFPQNLLYTGSSPAPPPPPTGGDVTPSAASHLASSPAVCKVGFNGKAIKPLEYTLTPSAASHLASSPAACMCVCVCERGPAAQQRVCVWEREGQQSSSVCVWERERASSPAVCVCVRERGPAAQQWERERVREGQQPSSVCVCERDLSGTWNYGNI